MLAIQSKKKINLNGFFNDFFLQISALMDKFEQQFEHLDVQSSYMEQAMSDTTTLTVPQVGQQFFSTFFCLLEECLGTSY